VTYQQRSFFERNRSRITVLAFAAALGVLVIWVFASSTAAAYECAQIFSPPATPAPTGSARLGVVQDDMGNSHITTGTTTRYTWCPPASGRHYNSPPNAGPIRFGLYGPEDQAGPQGWIHNLEHGSMVILYKCEGSDACTEEGQARLRDLLATFPNSPVCDLPPGGESPVIARFEQMAKPYAAIVWGRVMYLDTFDADRIKQFYLTEGEQINVPELAVRCARPSPSIGASAAPSVAPSVSPGGSVPASPAPGGSAPTSAAPSPGTSPSPSPATSSPG
jgi:hypothetical protein